jgi:uncharacterized protein (TIGR00288 family)
VPRYKSIIIFDGSNFYHKLKELKLTKTSSFNYLKFSHFISKNTQLTQLYYCVGKIRAKQNDKKARKMMAKQQAFVTGLQKQGFVIQFGYLLQSNNKFHEKGVDVQMAVNLLKGAFKNQYDLAFLVSSDSDLIPAINEIKQLGKKVCYIGFEHQPSFALLKSCSQSRLLTKKELLPFLKNKF